MTEKDLREEFLEKIAQVGFGDVISEPRILEIMGSDPRCRGIDLVKVKNGNSFMIMAGRREVSYRTAIKRYLGLKHTRTRRTWVASASRSTVQPQITAFRRASGAGPDKDIDHTGKDFCQLWRDWLIQEGLDESSIKIRKVCRVFVLADREQRVSWYRYHKENAELEVVTREEHRRRTKERRQKMVSA